MESQFSQLAKQLSMSEDAQSRLLALEDLVDFLKDANLDIVEFKKIWKILFFAMWDSDKIKNQNLLAAKISEVILEIQSQDQKFLWIKSAILILQKEWNKIDYLRINKFLLMIRLFFENIFKVLQNYQFQKDYDKEVINFIIKKVLQENQQTNGLGLHIIQIYVDCLQKLNIKKHIHYMHLINPWIRALSTNDQKLFRQNISENIFEKILNQKEDGELKFLKIDKLKEKLFEQAKKSDLNQANRSCLYSIISIYDDYQQPEKPLKKDKKEKQIDEAPKKKVKKEENKAQQEKKVKKEENNVQQDKKLKKDKTNDIQEKKQKKNKADNTDEDEPKKKKNKNKQSKILKDDYVEDDMDYLDEDQYELSDEENEQTAGQQNFIKDELNEVDFMSMSQDDLKKLYPNLPEYFFYTPKKRRKYFQNISKNYNQKIKNEKRVQKCSHTKNVKFNMVKSEIKVFDKNMKIKQEKSNQIQSPKSNTSLLKK